MSYVITCDIMEVRIMSSYFFFQNKFTSLSLAFKTDKITLTNRLELQQRQRDNAEKNIEEEINQLKAAIGVSSWIPYPTCCVV